MFADHRVDPTSLDAVLEALIRSSSAALDASDELLAHYGDTGDAPTQRAVDTMIESAADALRALTDSLADTSRDLQAAALRTTAFRPPSGLSGGQTDGSSAQSGRRRDHC